MTNKFGEQIHLEDLIQMRLIKMVLVTSSRQYLVALKDVITSIQQGL